MRLWHSLTDPKVPRHLISDEGEIVVDEVRRHPVAFIVPTLLMLVGLGIMVSVFWIPLEYAWAPLSLGLLTGLFGGYRALAAHMDRFVITNMRVFRVHGIFAQHTATMPMARILDISVHKPFIGRIFRYGHFVFESAAQDQGLRDIRFVGRPDERDLTIQRVIQRSGLRKAMQPPVADKESADSAEDEAVTPESDQTETRTEESEEHTNPDESRPENDEFIRESATDTDRIPGDSSIRDENPRSPGYAPAYAEGDGCSEGNAYSEEAEDTGEWSTIELTPEITGHSEEIRRRRLRADPVHAAATAWESYWPERHRMEAVASLMRVHRLLISALDDQLRPLGLTFARFEVLFLLSTAPGGTMPLLDLVDRVQVQTNSATALVKRLEDDGLIDRRLRPDEDGDVLAKITPEGRRMCDRAGRIISDARFGLNSLSEAECQRLTELLSWPRMAAGDF